VLRSLYDEFKASNAVQDEDAFEMAMDRIHNPLINRYLKLGGKHKGRRRRRRRKRKRGRRRRRRRKRRRRARRRRGGQRGSMRRRWRARVRRARLRRLRRYRRMRMRLRRYRRFLNHFKNFNGRYKRWYIQLYKKWYNEHYLPKLGRERNIQIGKHQIKSMKEAVAALNHGINAIERKHAPHPLTVEKPRKNDVWTLFAKLDHDGEDLHYDYDAQNG